MALCGGGSVRLVVPAVTVPPIYYVYTVLTCQSAFNKLINKINEHCVRLLTYLPKTVRLLFVLNAAGVLHPADVVT